MFSKACFNELPLQFNEDSGSKSLATAKFDTYGFPWAYLVQLYLKLNEQKASPDTPKQFKHVFLTLSSTQVNKAINALAPTTLGYITQRGSSGF